jgi:hypothetical protein
LGIEEDETRDRRNDINLDIDLEGNSWLLPFLLKLTMKQFQEFSLLLQVSSSLKFQTKKLNSFMQVMEENSELLHYSGMLWHNNSTKATRGKQFRKQPASFRDHREPHSEDKMCSS